MADTTINYDLTKPLGANLSAAVAKFIDARDEINRIVVSLNAAADGGATPANLEAAAGSPLFATPAGTGAALYTAVNNMKVNMEAVVVKNLDKGA